MSRFERMSDVGVEGGEGEGEGRESERGRRRRKRERERGGFPLSFSCRTV
jgi:hypothetical protein